MIKKEIKFFFVLLFFVNIIFGQEKKDEKIVITADEQVFDIKKNILSAKGNVKITYQNYFLAGDNITYNKEKQEIEILSSSSLKQENVTLTSDNMIINIETEEIRASGNIVFIQDEVEEKIYLSAQNLFAGLKKEEKKIIARDKVKITKGDITGTSDILELYPDENIAKLSGSSKVKMEKSEIQADKLIIYFNDKKIKADGSAKVTAYPEKK